MLAHLCNDAAYNVWDSFAGHLPEVYFCAFRQNSFLLPNILKAVNSSDYFNLLSSLKSENIITISLC